MDPFWRVFRKNLDHSNIVRFIEAYFASEMFLYCLYGELESKEIRRVAQHLAGAGISYAEQIPALDR